MSLTLSLSFYIVDMLLTLFMSLSKNSGVFSLFWCWFKNESTMQSAFSFFFNTQISGHKVIRTFLTKCFFFLQSTDSEHGVSLHLAGILIAPFVVFPSQTDREVETEVLIWC